MEGTVNLSLKDFLDMKKETETATATKRVCKELLEDAHKEYTDYFTREGFSKAVLNDLAAINKKVASKYMLEL